MVSYISISMSTLEENGLSSNYFLMILFALSAGVMMLVTYLCYSFFMKIVLIYGLKYKYLIWNTIWISSSINMIISFFLREEDWIKFFNNIGFSPFFFIMFGLIAYILLKIEKWSIKQVSVYMFLLLLYNSLGTFLIMLGA